MSKKAWSPGRMMRSLKTWGCGEQRSPDTALMLSTCSLPRSNRNFVTSATSWLSLTPGLSFSAISWYAPSTMAQAVLSSVISSIDFTSRASSMTCWASSTADPLRLERREHRRLDDVEAQRHVVDTLAPEDRRDLLRGPREQAGVRRDGATEADHAAVDVLRRQPGAAQSMMLGSRAEVPEVRLAAPRQQGVAGHLVASPLADVGARDIADVVEVEQQHRADVGSGQGGLCAPAAGTCGGDQD